MTNLSTPSSQPQTTAPAAPTQNASSTTGLATATTAAPTPPALDSAAPFAVDSATPPALDSPAAIAAQNKQRMQAIFTALATGDRRPFRDAIADDMTWTIIGTTRWSKTFTGRESILADLLTPLHARFAGTYRATAHRLIAEGDLVVVESRGDVVTTEGKPYCNAYCFVCRLAGGQIREITEYCDTALIDAVL